MNTTTDRRSIRTVYRKTRFRSKLEADWARVFDVMGIEWQYEAEGRYFEDTFYLPDFFFPQSRQHGEVKALLNNADARKIRSLLGGTERRRFVSDPTLDVPLVAFWPDGVFDGWCRSAATIGNVEEFTADRVPVSAYQCVKCTGWWFSPWMPDEMEITCECCGASGLWMELVARQIESSDCGCPSLGYDALRGFPDLRSLRHACRV